MGFTPGPWVRKNGHIVASNTGEEINHLVDNATYEANETLKAAAPELFEACKAMLKANTPFTIDHAFVIMRQAVIKAGWKDQ